jgi:hypothetical protein
MNRFITRIGAGGEVVAAAVTSIVLTVLSMIDTVLRIHADQTEWAEVTATPETAPADHDGAEKGGGSAWV